MSLIEKNCSECGKRFRSRFAHQVSCSKKCAYERIKKYRRGILPIRRAERYLKNLEMNQ